MNPHELYCPKRRNSAASCTCRYEEDDGKISRGEAFAYVIFFAVIAFFAVRILVGIWTI